MAKKSNQSKDDFVFEPDLNEDGSSDLVEKIKNLKKELKFCQTEKIEYLNGWQRAKADYHNLETKTKTEKAEIIKYANSAILEDLISLADNFEMAWANQEVWEQAPLNWRQGIEYIYNQLISTLANYHLTILNPLGEKFDPNQHEPIEMIETNKPEEDGVILTVSQKGYKLYDKIIRPAKVKVGETKNN